MKLFEFRYLSFMGEKWQNLPFLGRTRTLVPVPKVGTSNHGPRQSGTGTHSQKRVDTGTDQSGTGTNASSSPDFYTFALLSPRFVH